MSATDTDQQKEEPQGVHDPRALLAAWANSSDEWVRLLVAEVIGSGRAVPEGIIEIAYQLFREEKAFDERTLPAVEELNVEDRQDESAPPLAITRLSEVRGVNALVPGAIIEPHDGLTILYGENGTGKTGYSRIFKALANSRTADEILGNIAADHSGEQAANVEYRLGGDERGLEWGGERGVAPFTRMSIFDSPCVTAHVDDDLDYVYVPAALALFNHVIEAIQAVSARIDAATKQLAPPTTTLLGRFPRESTAYPLIETLGASSDLGILGSKRSSDPKVDEKIDVLVQAVAALKANTLGTQITTRQRELRALEQAQNAAATLAAFDIEHFNHSLTVRERLASDYETFRSELFAAADLPADPEETWGSFVEAGERYRQHLDALGVHDADRCLYCRQPLEQPARELLAKYSSYLEDKISSDLSAINTSIRAAETKIGAVVNTEVEVFLRDHEGQEHKPVSWSAVNAIAEALRLFREATTSRTSLDTGAAGDLASQRGAVDAAVGTTKHELEELQEQSSNRLTALAEKERELAELRAAGELARSWTAIEMAVKNAKEADRLTLLRKPLPSLTRAVTELSKAASDQLINQSFDALFVEECEALRAPELKVQFVGRQGRAQRRKVLQGKHKPSKVLSEGEQKVLAMADFLAEARLAGITAPVIFDDPVSSLDHRRINEVAQRVVNLAEDHQVIVFTHDILFATTLLSLSEKSKRCTYFQITDDGGKGQVTRATGPRWDSLGSIRARINETIQAAQQQNGESRDALIRTGYGWLRSWCEVFTELELLRGVTQRYQPNVGMTRLDQIDTAALEEIVPEVVRIFEDACRYIDAHSQPLASLGVAPTLSGLEADWRELQQLKRRNDGKT